MPEKDEELYALFQAGDEDGLRILMERYREPLTMFLFGIVHNPEDAEELAMDAFAAASSGTVRYAGKSSWKTWLYSIGRNLALKHLRRQRTRRRRAEEGFPERKEQLPETELLNRESSRELYAALQEIPEQYRHVLYLTEVENTNPEEAARIMGKSRRQIYNLTFRGKKALKQVLAWRSAGEET